jgi:transposase
MNKATTIGIDLAKNVFQVATLNRHDKLTSNKAFSRVKLMNFMVQHPRCVVGLEACGSAHYWGRWLGEIGHAVKLLPPAYVKGLVYGNKHDVNDAKAIALAAAQAESPTVCMKTPEQLSLQALMRVRERRVSQRTDCANQIRGLLYEHGIVINKGLRAIQQIQVDTIPEVIRPLMVELLCEYESTHHYVKASDQSVQRLVKAHPIGQRLLQIPGFGVMNGLAALIVNPSDFRNGRHYAAYLGLVPKQTGTGGQIRTHGLSKRGNRYHRQLLCHGARAFLNGNKTHSDPLWQWAKRIQLKKGNNVAVCALANKLSRISWRVLKGEAYRVDKAVSPVNP